LLIGAGLLIRTVVNVLNIDPGFALQHTVSFDIALTQTRYPDPRKIPYFEKLLPQLAAIPGVERVSAVHPLPLRWPVSKTFTISGHPTSSDKPPDATYAVVMPGYFETLAIPLLRGRTFTSYDNNAKSPPVAVINRSFARKFFPDEDPIGRYFTPEVSKPGEARVARQIVGIMGDTRTADLWNPYQPEYFLPYAQDPTHQRPLIVMKVAGDPANYEEVARKLVSASDPDAPLFGYGTFVGNLEKQAIQPRFEAWMISVFAAVALTLSAVGLYTVLSYIVVQRTRELGLRMALGASRGDLLQLVLRRGLRLAAIGIGVGCLISFYGSRLLASLLFKIAPLDPTVFSIVTLALIFVSLLSAVVPAVRAAWIEPMRCLRAEW
jgi:predicted permease